MCGTSRSHQESKDNAVTAGADALPDLLGENAQLPRTQTEGFELLPDEMLQQVISFLPVCVVPFLQAVCQRWKTVVRLFILNPIFRVKPQPRLPSSPPLPALPHFTSPSSILSQGTTVLVACSNAGVAVGRDRTCVGRIQDDAKTQWKCTTSRQEGSHIQRSIGQALEEPERSSGIHAVPLFPTRYSYGPRQGAYLPIPRKYEGQDGTTGTCRAQDIALGLCPRI